MLGEFGDYELLGDRVRGGHGNAVLFHRRITDVLNS